MDERSYQHGKQIAYDQALLIIECVAIKREDAASLIRQKMGEAEAAYQAEVEAENV